jgi:hypothetical protein
LGKLQLQFPGEHCSLEKKEKWNFRKAATFWRHNTAFWYTWNSKFWRKSIIWMNTAVKMLKLSSELGTL